MVTFNNLVNNSYSEGTFVKMLCLSLAFVSIILYLTLVKEIWMLYITVGLIIALGLNIILYSEYSEAFINYFVEMPVAQKVFFIFIIFSVAVLLFVKAYYYIAPPNNAYLRTDKDITIGDPHNIGTVKAKSVLNRFRNVVTIPNSNIPKPLDQEFSYSCWLKVCPKNFVKGTDKWWMVMGKGMIDDDMEPYEQKTPGLFLKPNVNTLVATVYCEDGPSSGNAVEISDIPLNEWFCVSVVLEQNTMTVYINGKMVRQITLSGTIKYNGGDMTLGTFYGAISFLRASSTSLTPKAVNRKYLEEKMIIDGFQKTQDKCYSRGEIKKLVTNCYFIDAN